MAPKFEAMSPAQLQALLKGPTVSIYYKPYAESESQVIRDGFPRNVLTTFSKLFESQFPALNKIALVDLCKGVSKNAVITGGRLEAHNEILTWMLACCQGRGLTEFPRIQHEMFWRYATILEATQVLQVDYLTYEVTERLEAIARKQVHSEDIRKVFDALPAGNLIRSLVIESVGQAILERRLRAWTVYNTVQEEYPEFKHGLDNFLTAKGSAPPNDEPSNKRDHKCWEEYKTEEEQKFTAKVAQEIKDNEGLAYRKQRQAERRSGTSFSSRQTSSESSSSENSSDKCTMAPLPPPPSFTNGSTTPTTNPSLFSRAPENEPYRHKTIRATHVRKDSQGKKRWATLSLSDCEISHDDFVGFRRRE